MEKQSIFDRVLQETDVSFTFQKEVDNILPNLLCFGEYDALLSQNLRLIIDILK
jgi:hypothetical protein